MREPHPLATIHDAVLEFSRGRTDAVLFGAQAVNAYVDESRMTQDVDILSTRGEELAEELRAFLSSFCLIDVGIRFTADERLWRLYQDRQPKKRHLVDVHQVDTFPEHRVVDEVLVVSPDVLIGQKLKLMVSRSKTASGPLDLADIHRVLIAFPELKVFEGAIAERLRVSGASEAVLSAWREIVGQEIVLPNDEDGY